MDIWGNGMTASADRTLAMRRVCAHYQALFGDDPAVDGLRESCAMRDRPAHNGRTVA